MKLDGKAISDIVLKRQSDVNPPVCHGRDSSQYREVNGPGPETARVLAEAFEDRVSDVSHHAKTTPWSRSTVTECEPG